MKRLTGTRGAIVTEQHGGTGYEGCPPWVPAAVERCVATKLIPRPTAIIWHQRQTSTRWGTCWPQQGRIHVYPWAGERREVDDDLMVDTSGELMESRIGSRIVPGAQLESDVEDTLAHELAHLTHAKHGDAHTALTAKLVELVRASRSA